MIKKAIVRTCIFDYADEKGHKTIQNVLDDLPELYKYLKSHKDFGNLLPNIEYSQFVQAVHIGLQEAILNMQFEKHFS